MNAWLIFGSAAAACERCFGAAADSPVVYGIGLSMLALLALTIVVWGGIISFFSQVEKRAKLLASGELIVTDDGTVVPAASRAGLDELLEKVHRHGFDHLTPEEQRRLHDLAAP